MDYCFHKKRCSSERTTNPRYGSWWHRWDQNLALTSRGLLASRMTGFQGAGSRAEESGSWATAITRLLDHNGMINITTWWKGGGQTLLLGTSWWSSG